MPHSCRAVIASRGNPAPTAHKPPGHIPNGPGVSSERYAGSGNPLAAVLEHEPELDVLRAVPDVSSAIGTRADSAFYGNDHRISLDMRSSYTYGQTFTRLEWSTLFRVTMLGYGFDRLQGALRQVGPICMT
jgi:hypothetical protein